MRSVAIVGFVVALCACSADPGTSDGGRCTDECSAGAARCASAGAQAGPQPCAVGSDGCFHWGTVSPCAVGQACSVDHCVDELCGPSNPTGVCSSGRVCVAGSCCTPAQACAGRCCAAGQVCTAGTCTTPRTACSPSNPTGTCPAGFACAGGTCCAVGCVTTAGTCCNGTDVCVQNSMGTAVCEARCTHNTECPRTASCCQALQDSSGNVLPYGACEVGTSASACRCGADSDCNTGGGYYCTPSLNATGNPVQPYVCTAAACSAYHRCTGVGSCPTGYCELCNAEGCFCTQSCVNDTMCGGAHCQLLTGGGTTCGNLHGCVP